MTAPTHSNDLNNAVTQDAMASFSKATDPRLAHVMSLLVKHLHAFVDESQLSKAECSLYSCVSINVFYFKCSPYGV